MVSIDDINRQIAAVTTNIKCPNCTEKHMLKLEEDTGGYLVECPTCRTRSRMSCDGYRLFSYQYEQYPSGKFLKMAIHREGEPLYR